jgi:hypothetical protein
MHKVEVKHRMKFNVSASLLDELLRDFPDNALDKIPSVIARNSNGICAFYLNCNRSLATGRWDQYA